VEPVVLPAAVVLPVLEGWVLGGFGAVVLVTVVDVVVELPRLGALPLDFPG
jgi:hypothetical protein